MRLISAGSLVRAQSGPPGTQQATRRAPAASRAFRNRQTEIYHFFEVWHEPENSDPDSWSARGGLGCSLTSAYWVENTTLENRNEGLPSFLIRYQIIKLLRAYDECLGANRRRRTR